MPNLISQMRNGYNPIAQPQQNQSLDASIMWAKSMMNQMKFSANPEQALKSMIEQNPQFSQVASMLKGSPNGLQGLAQQMARERGIDLNMLIQKLQQ